VSCLLFCILKLFLPSSLSYLIFLIHGAN
jgi:hypothetical protein